MRTMRSLFVIFLITIHIHVWAFDYEVEPNHLLSNAMAITSGQSLQGNIGSIDDLDTFKIVAKTSRPVRVFYRRPPRQYIYNIANIKILDAAGAEINNAVVYAPRIYTTLDFNTTTGRTYYIQISGCQEQGFGSECANHRSEAYELVAVQFPQPLFESEPNDSTLSANVVAANAWVFAQHSAETDIDTFRINLPGAGNFLAQLTRPSDNYVYSLSNIAILDNTGALLNSDDIYAPEGTGRVVLGTTGPKTIYLKVTSCSNCDNTFSDQYQITTSFKSLAELSISDTSVNEGNAGTKQATFLIKLSQATTSPVTYNIFTTNGSASVGSDYVAKSLSRETIPAGATQKAFTVTINGDTSPEANETYFVKVGNVLGASVARGQAIGTIRNDD